MPLTPEEVAVLQQQEMAVEIDPAQEIIVVRARARFDLSAKVTVIPFAMLDMMYWQALSVRLQKAGMVQSSGQATQVGGVASPVRGPSPAPESGVLSFPSGDSKL